MSVIKERPKMNDYDDMERNCFLLYEALLFACLNMTDIPISGIVAFNQIDKKYIKEAHELLDRILLVILEMEENVPTEEIKEWLKKLRDLSK